MKRKYDRSKIMVDYVIDLRPQDIREQVLPVIEINTSINHLELIFENIFKGA